jgi:trehalose 6-phosphate phosphatase
MADAFDVLRSDPGSSGLFLDFDGTLSDIVAHPEHARPVDGAVEALRAAAPLFAIVAVVSGRRARGLAGRLGRPPGVRCFGLYGLEDESGPLDPASARFLEALERVLPELERAAAEVPGAWVEPKGFHASVHYRAAPDPDRARDTLMRSLQPVAADAGMELLEGKRVIEVAPKEAPSKGDLVERVVREQGIGALLYAGDDRPDVDAFDAVERLRRDGIAGVTIAVRSAGTPVELLERADLVLESPSALVELLRGLVSPR